MKRIIWGVILFAAIFVLPWWIVFLFALASSFYFEKYYEIIFLALIADVLYGSFIVLNCPYSITLISIICLYIISKFKNNLVAY
jgi:hypothetical protein